MKGEQVVMLLAADPLLMYLHRMISHGEFVRITIDDDRSGSGVFVVKTEKVPG